MEEMSATGEPAGNGAKAAAGDKAEAAAGDGAGAAVFEAVGERLTKILPRIARSALRETRAAAASSSVEGGEAKDAAVAAMGNGGAPRAAARSGDQAPTYLTEGRREGVEGRLDPVANLGEDGLRSGDMPRACHR
jgi:hypothetical protein